MLNLIRAKSHIELMSEAFIKWQREHDTGCKCLQEYNPVWQIKDKDLSVEQAIALLQPVNCNADYQYISAFSAKNRCTKSVQRYRFCHSTDPFLNGKVTTLRI